MSCWCLGGWGWLLIGATGQTIGLLVLAAMDAKTRDVDAVIGDFKRCLNSYETWAESFFSFSALDIEQVFKVEARGRVQ